MTFYERIENQGTQTLAVWMFIELLARMCNVLRLGSEVCNWLPASCLEKKEYSLHSAFCTQPAFYSQSAVCILHSLSFYPWSAVRSLQSAVRSLQSPVCSPQSAFYTDRRPNVFHWKEQHTNFLRKLHLFILTSVVKMLWWNASIRKECFLPTQFNEFAADKQANLLAFKRGQNICIMQWYWIRA